MRHIDNVYAKELGFYCIFEYTEDKTNVTSLTLSSRTLSNPTSGQIKSQVFCFLNATGQGLLSELT